MKRVLNLVVIFLYQLVVLFLCQCTVQTGDVKGHQAGKFLFQQESHTKW